MESKGCERKKYKEYCLMDLLPILTDIDLKNSRKIAPSCFLNEMQLSTEQRLAKLNLPLRKMKVIPVKAFKISPDIAIFQNFQPKCTYAVTVKFLNVHNVCREAIKHMQLPILKMLQEPKALRINMEPSIYFSYKYITEDISCKLAPGMGVQLEILFFPEELKDYNHEITLYTEGETVDFPIIAIGPRPLLDIPDKIVLPTTAHNIQTEKTLITRNLGEVVASYTLEISPPFSIAPERGLLNPGQFLQLTIFFLPTVLGRVQKELKIRYETGEVLTVSVEGLCEEADVQISVTEVNFTDTYLNLTQSLPIEIKNETKYNLSFMFKKLSSLEEELKLKNNMKNKFEQMKDYEILRDTTLIYHEIADHNTNEMVYDRILEDEKKILDAEDCFFFHSGHFVTSPIKGDLWPRSKMIITCIFAPKVVRDFEETAYLEISGQNLRHEINFTGTCIGPKVVLNVAEIDGQNIYVQAEHLYEIMFTNVGPIPATIRYNRKPLQFGGKLSLIEDNFYLEAGKNKSIVFSFSSETRGKFIENINFDIVESKEKLSFALTGNIICPLLQFNVPEVNFGDVPIGYPVKMDFFVSNASQVAIEFSIGIPEDGNKKAYTLDDVRDLSKHSSVFILRKEGRTKQFVIEPTNGVVAPYKELAVQITLTPNIIGAFTGNLTLYMWSSRKNTKAIPVKCIAHYPTISCSPPKIDLNSVFVTKKYTCILRLDNLSLYPGVFSVDVWTEKSELYIEVEENIHYIGPKGVVFLNVVLHADVVGMSKAEVKIHIFGALTSSSICTIFVITRGPSVDVDIEKINLGEINTLTLIKKDVKLTNNSPIPANVTLRINGDFVTAVPNSFLVEPEQVVGFTLNIYGTRPGRFKNMLRVEVENSDVDTYIITGNCVGGSILCQPPLQPVYDFGTILTQREVIHEIKLTNKGNKIHQLIICKQKTVTKFKDSNRFESSTDAHHFQMIPAQLTLLPLETVTVKLQAFSAKEKEIEETLYMHAKIDKANNILLLMQFKVYAIFQEPSLSYSTSTIEFRKDVGVDKVTSLLEVSWSLRSTNNATLWIDLDIDAPFYFIEEGNCVSDISFTLESGEIMDLMIKFEPSAIKEASRLCFESYGYITVKFKNHPKKEKIGLIGKVNYPDIEFIPKCMDLGGIWNDRTVYSFFIMKNRSPLPASFRINFIDNYKITPLIDNCLSASETYGDLLGRLSADKNSHINKNSKQQDVDEKGEFAKKEECLYLKHVLFPLIAKYDYSCAENDLEVLKLLFDYKDYDDIQNIIDIVPREGILSPYECQLVSINIQLPPKTLLEASLEYSVEGGASGLLNIKAKSSSICFHIDGKDIDLGVVPFSRVISRKYYLKNTGNISFAYSVKLLETFDSFEGKPRWLDIEPRAGYINPSDTVTFVIDYFPGIIGLFTEKVLLNFAFEEPILLTIKGCGVYPQVYFTFPRPDLYENPVVCYNAIASIVYPEHIRLFGKDKSSITSRNSTIILDDWVYVDNKTLYPTSMDIDLAIERQLVKNRLKEEESIIERFYYRPRISIPNYVAPRYIINFGYVTVGTTAERALLPIYYGNTNIKIFWPKLKRKALDKGFNLIFTNESPHPLLVFKPSPKAYLTMNQKAEYNYQASIQGGVVLEFEVCAVVTIPVVTITPDVLDFGQVTCGECLRKSIILHNSGNVPCLWKSSILKNCFSMNKREGQLRSGEKFPIEISFEPKNDSSVFWDVIITVDMNPEGNKLHLKGRGMTPTIAIEPRIIIFPSALPHSVNNVIPFTITNTSQIPLEIVFTDLDTDMNFEEHVMKCLLLLYNVKKMYGPPMAAGKVLSENILKAYENLIGILREKMQQEYISELIKRQEDEEEEMDLDASLINIEGGDIPDPLNGKNLQEIRILIQANIDYLRAKQKISAADMQSKLLMAPDTKMNGKHDLSEFSEGVLLIFYGAPQTEFQLAANRLARKLELDVYSIDELIKRMLVKNNLLAAIKINEEIERAFEKVSQNVEGLFTDTDDALDILNTKLTLIQNYEATTVPRQSIQKQRVQKNEKRSKASGSNRPSSLTAKSKNPDDQSTKSGSKSTSKNSKKEARKPKKPTDTFLGLSEDYFTDLLTSEVQALESGIVIETLNSIFIINPRKILSVLLEAVGNIRHIQVVYFANPAEHFIQEKLKELKNTDSIPDDLLSSKIEMIQNVTADEFDKLSESDLKIYKEYILQPRKVGKNRPGTTAAKTKPTRTTVKENERHKSNKTSDQISLLTNNTANISNPDKILMEKSSMADKEILKEFTKAEEELNQIKHILEYWDKKNLKLTKQYTEPKVKTGVRAKKPKALSKKGSSKDSKRSKGSEKSKVTGGTKISLSKAREPQQIQVKILTSEEVLVREYTGIPLWIVNHVSSQNAETTDEIIVSELCNFEDLLNSVDLLRKSLNKEISLTDHLFAILSEPNNQICKKISEYFIIKLKHFYNEADIKIRSVSTNASALSTLSKRSREKARRSDGGSSKQKSISHSEISLLSARPSQTTTSRFILQPNAKVEFEISFCPKRCCLYNHNYSIEILSWRKPHLLTIVGRADIPRILTAPEKMFSMVALDSNISQTLKHTFYKKLNTLNFGPVLAKKRHSADFENILKDTVACHISSDSTLETFVRIILLDELGNFSTDINTLHLFPGRSKILNIYSHPETVGLVESKLLFIIKDNPKIEIIKLAAFGDEINFEITPNKLMFERVLQNISMTKELVIKNNSLLPIYWNFDDPENVLSNFKASCCKGYIDSNGQQIVSFKYKSAEIGVLNKMALEFKITDFTKTNVYTEKVALSTEVIELIIDCNDTISFHELKLNTEAVEQCKMVNKSNYDVKFRFNLIENPCDSEDIVQIKRCVSLDQKEGILKVAQPITIRIKFKPEIPLGIDYLPIYNVQFYDLYDERNLHNIVLKMSGNICFSKYEICPPGGFDFGNQLIQTEISRDVVLKNVGKYPFNYTIISMRKLKKTKKPKSGKKDKKGKSKKHSLEKGTKKKSASSKSSSTRSSKKLRKKGRSSSSSKSSKTGSKKQKPTILNEGIFSLVSVKGTVEPENEVIIKISSKPNQVGNFKESVVFKISESLEGEGSPFYLKTNGCLPCIDFSYLGDIFKEIYVIDSIKDKFCQEQMDANPVFIKDENELSFNKNCLNIPREVRLKIRNYGVVAAEIISAVSGSSDFDVKPKSIIIDGYKYEFITVTFTPKTIAKIYGILEIKIATNETNKMVVQLTGEGYLPEISVVEPELDTRVNKYVVHFNPIIIGSTVSKNIVIKNCGILKCRILLRVEGDANKVFAIILEKYPPLLEKLFNKENLIEQFGHTITADLKPLEECKFQLQFTPSDAKISEAVVKVFIINNPYETILMHASGEGFKQDIVIEGLEAISGNDLLCESSVSDERISYYELNFGYRSVGKLHKLCFTIRNISTTDTYKFVFCSMDRLNFYPMTGHLKPNAYKEVIVTFCTKEPMLFDKFVVQCRAFKIVYVDFDYEPTSWDDRQNFAVWESVQVKNILAVAQEDPELNVDLGSSKVKMIKDRIEPCFERFADSERTINLLLSAVVDFCSYECDVEEILFRDTLMFEKEKSTFNIRNTSNVPITINWTLIMVQENNCSKLNEFTRGDGTRGRITKEKLNTSRSDNGFPGPLRAVSLVEKEHFLEISRPKTSSSHSTFSTMSSGHAGAWWSEEDNLPFSITPKNTVIKPYESQLFITTFSPNDIYDLSVFAKSDIDNLVPNQKPPNIFIRGKSIFPMYYINLEPSDYIMNRREGREICGQSFDSTTKVIEFKTIGIGIVSTKKYTITNPTNESFSYRWESGNKGNISVFHCRPKEGSVTKGETSTVEFSFQPQNTGVFETFFVFCIEKYDLRTLFLLVGTAREPCMFFNIQTLILKATVLGIDVSSEEVTIKNNEGMPLWYKIVKSTLYSDTRTQKLVVHPLHGEILPKREQTLRITYHPEIVGIETFNIECKVEKMQKPMLLVVTTTCYEVQCNVKYLNDDEYVNLENSETTTIELFSMVKYKSDILLFRIENFGKIGFYYKWISKEKRTDNQIQISFEQKEGYLKSANVTDCKITLHPIKQLRKTTLHLLLEIPYGPTYKINCVCTTSKAKLKLSFKEFDFGPYLVQNFGNLNYGKELEIFNNEITPSLVEVDQDQLPFLTIANKNITIPPKESGKILFYFHPLEVKKYSADIILHINGMCHSIKISGEGVPLEVEVVSSEDKCINLGPTGLNKIKKRRVKVVNNSKCTIAIYFELHDRLPFFGRDKRILEAEYEVPEVKPSDSELLTKKNKKGEKGRNKSKGKKGKKSSKEGSSNSSKSKGKTKRKKSSGSSEAGSKTSKQSNKNKKGKAKHKNKGSKESETGSKKGKKGGRKRKGSGKASDGKQEKADEPKETPEQKEHRLTYDFIKINPKKWIKLSAGQTTDFYISYIPLERMPLFTEQVYYQVEDNIHPICTLKASCVASEYYLDQPKISFGTVIKDCVSELCVNLYNTGDIGGNFKWSLNSKNVFYIEPIEGYITPNMCVTFKVKFAPTFLHCLLRTMAHCNIEYYSKVINLPLQGTCIDFPAPKDTIKFACPVRQTQIKEITLPNLSGKCWDIIPSISGQYFNIENKISVLPKSSLLVPVSYTPLVMTGGKLHEGKIFFPLPEGQGFVYNVIGEATKPEITRRIENTIYTKTLHIETLNVSNWLPIPQRFNVVNQIDQSAQKIKVLYKLSGNDVIAVPAFGEREYKWKIYALNEGKVTFKIKFRNETTKEYIVYEVILTILNCNSLKAIKLSTCVRKSTTHIMKLENPLKLPTTFQLTSSCQDLHFPSTVTLDPYSETDISIDYRPLLATPEFTVNFEAKSNTLGIFPFTFVLKALPPEPEESVIFETSFGQIVHKTIYMYNFTDATADVASQVEDGQFRVETCKIPPKEKGLIKIYFDPDYLGGNVCKCSLFSPTLGQYIYPLIGNCTLPKPQGPYVIQEGVLNTIPFNNPFPELKIFNLNVEPNTFLLKTEIEVAKPKALIRIQVSFDDTVQKHYPITGKLFVTCKDDNYETLKWIIYLTSEIGTS